MNVVTARRCFYGPVIIMFRCARGRQGCTVIDFLLKRSVIFVLCGTRNVVYFSFVLYLVPFKPRLCFCKDAKWWSPLNLSPNRCLYSEVCAWKAQMCLFKCPRRWTDCKFSETLICLALPPSCAVQLTAAFCVLYILKPYILLMHWK